MAEKNGSPERREDADRERERQQEGRAPGEEPVELSERGGVTKQQDSPDDYSDRTRDRRLDEEE